MVVARSTATPIVPTTNSKKGAKKERTYTPITNVSKRKAEERHGYSQSVKYGLQNALRTNRDVLIAFIPRDKKKTTPAKAPSKKGTGATTVDEEDDKMDVFASDPNLLERFDAKFAAKRYRYVCGQQRLLEWIRTKLRSPIDISPLFQNSDRFIEGQHPFPEIPISKPLSSTESTKKASSKKNGKKPIACHRSDEEDEGYSSMDECEEYSD
jgi:hypothetical protein